MTGSAMTGGATTGSATTGSARPCGPLTGLLGCEIPLIQAGMGGVAGPPLVAAVANAGAAGIVGLYKHKPEEIRALIAQTRQRTERVFGINLVPEVVDEAVLAEQVKAVLAEPSCRPFITFFGLAPSAVCDLARAAGRPLLVQVGSLEEARTAVARGAQALILQGHGAGGHHLGTASTQALLAAVRADDLGVPLVVAGGIGSGAEFVRYRRQGAAGALCGTLFICARESWAHPAFKQRVIAAEPRDTMISSLFEIGWPGRPHRVLHNRLTRAEAPLPRSFIGRTEYFGRPYPVPRYSAAVPTVFTQGKVEEMAMYCGTSCRDIEREAGAAEIVAAFAKATLTAEAAARAPA